MSSSTNIFVKQKIDRYELQQPLGVGGMARVYVGWDTVLERPVAIKFLHDHLAEDATFKERFQREARLVATLNHPNIVQIYDYNLYAADGRMSPYMVMPYITGKTLKELLTETCARSEKLSYERILSIMLDLTSALTYAHNRGMVHRDVKPSNILFDEHNHAVLMDFGIARLAEVAQLTQEGATVGTPTYMSPEQASGSPVDGRADLYALGVILYEMLAGRPPFNDESIVAIILHHLNTPIPPITQFEPSIAPDLEAVVAKGLSKKPEERYQTAQEFADALRRVLDISPTAYSSNITPGFIRAAQPTPTANVPGQPVASPQRSSVKRLALGAVLVTVMVVAAFLLRGALPGENNTSLAKGESISSMTEEENVAFLSSFAADDLTNPLWQQTDEGNVLRQITTDGFYRFDNRLPATAETALYNPKQTYKNAIITLDAMLTETSPNASGYGIVFRYQDAMNYNVFAIDGTGRYSVWALATGVWTELRGVEERWTASDYIKPAGQRNQVVVSFADDHIVGYVNQEKVADVRVATDAIMSGSIGIYLASTSGGPASVLIDSYQVGGQIPSMTANSS